MSFNINFSAPGGIVTVKIPTEQLGVNTSVDQAPFRLQIQTTSGGTSTFENVSSGTWSVLSSVPNGDTTYTRNTPLSGSQVVELMPLSGVTMMTGDFYFPATGFIAADGPLKTVSVTEPDNIAPTLGAGGIQLVNTMTDNVTPLPNTEGKDSSYTVSFSERVTLPLIQGQSLFGGVPSGTTFVLTPMNVTAGIFSSDLWHVIVTTPTTDATVNLTLTPKLQVTSYETTNVSLPATGTEVFGSNTANYWAKVTLDGDLYEGRNFVTGDLDVTIMGPNNSMINAETISVATSTTEKNALYLGFSSPLPQLQVGYEYEVKLYENSTLSRASPLGGMIVDSSGNQMGYASVENTENPMEPFVSSLTDENIGTFVSQGTLSAFEVLDMSRLTSGPLIVDAEYGFLTVYDQNGQPQYKAIDFYDKYILNDRPTKFVPGAETGTVEVYDPDLYNIFYGTTDSEYVVVGDGGGNDLIAGNQGSGSAVPETDIIDFSEVTFSEGPESGVIVNLGNSASATVNVIYDDGREQDYISGFEGVVGSAGDDRISGSNAGNYLSGGDGDDVLRGYSTNPNGDLLYEQPYLNEVYGVEATRSENKWNELWADSSDILVGGAGNDTLYGGAGSDFLVDLDAAVMWGSDITGSNGGLRDSDDSDLAEYDAFMVRGGPIETATIENFHLSKSGTGLAGRSYDAHDSIIFSATIFDVIKYAYANPERGAELFGEFLTNGASVGTGTTDPILKVGSGPALYNYIYDKLKFTQTEVAGTSDMKLTATFSDRFEETTFEAKIGEVIIADLKTALVGTGVENEASVVELKWLAATIANTPELFNPKMDFDMIGMDEGSDSSFLGMKIAVALELMQAGTIREVNEYGVMASNLDDMSLVERIFNPGEASEAILGSAAKDSYEFIVQDFADDPTSSSMDYQTGNDTIFDIGGNDDTLAFSEATISDLRFSAVQVGRESGRNSLRVEYDQTLINDNGASVITNSGNITWQGHFRQGGRQAAEFVEVSDDFGGGVKYAMAKTEYEYDRKGYVIAGSDKLVAEDTFNAIMVGRNDGNDDFVFKALSGTTQTQQKASIAGFNQGDSIDISSYLREHGVVAQASMVGEKAVVVFKDTATSNVNFTLELTFQEAVVPLDLLALYGTTT
jgi:Ca2+-binding RTX toxin-like protein